MNSHDNNLSTIKERITILRYGPYRVRGKVSLVNKTQIVSQYGGSLTWKKES